MRSAARSFALRLNDYCRLKVKEAEQGERILPGHAYIAPGGLHLSVERSGANYIARVQDGDPVNRHKPSVEVLFNSVAEQLGGVRRPWSVEGESARIPAARVLT